MRLPAYCQLLIKISVVIPWACLSISQAFAAPPLAGLSQPVVDQVDLGNPLLLPQDRQQEQWLDSARKSLEEGDYGQVVVLLRRMIATDDDSFLASPGNSTLTSARDQAGQLAAKLPVEVRQRLEVELDRIAQESWQTTKQAPSSAALGAFLNRYRMTGLGLEALRLTAANDRDAGRHRLAAVGWQAVRRHPLATKQQQTNAALALFDTLLSAGDLQSAEQLAVDLKLSSVSNTMIAGKEVNPTEWMQSRLRERQQMRPASALTVSSSDPRLPAPVPVWTRSLATIPEFQKAGSLIQRFYRDQGVISSPVLRPVIFGNIVLTRSMQELVACDIKTGEQIWAVPNQEYGWLAKRSGAPEISPARSGNAAGWYRRSEVDSVFASIASQGNLVVVVQEPDRSMTDFSTATSAPRPVNAPATNTYWNKLCGYDLGTRQLVWQMGGPPTGPADVFGGITFLGVPLFVDNLLFVVARRDDELVLLAMDQATGHLRWSVSLGVLAPHLADNLARRRIACPVIMGDGVLLCPTAAGMLVAVNPLTRSIEWAYRYPLLQHDLPLRAGAGVPTAVLTDAWWNEWREVSLHQVAAKDKTPGVILLTSPDTERLHAIHATTGIELWNAPRGAGLHLAGVLQNVALVVESMAVRGHDLQTGRLLWRAETGEISGRGAISGDYLLQPRRAGGVAAINVANGTQITGLAATDKIYKSIVPCDDGWIAQTDDELHRLPLLETIRQSAQARWEAEPTEMALMELARLDLQAGRPDAARQRLHNIDTSDAQPIRREAILTMLRQQSNLKQESPAESRLDDVSLGEELLSLCADDGERLIALRAMGDAAHAVGDLSRATSLYLDGLQLIETIGLRYVGYWTADTTSARSVRADRILLGAIQRILDESHTKAQTRDLEQLLNDRLEAAKRDDDPFAMQRLLDRMLPLEWTRRAILSNETMALYARPPQKVDPLILSIAGSRDQETSAKGYELFARLQSRSGSRQDAETIQRRLLALSPGTPLSNGRTLGATLASQEDRSETRGHVLGPSPDLWPNRLPTVERESDRHQDVYLLPVRVQSSPGSLLHQIDVSVERNGAFVRFAHAGYSGTWDRKLPGPSKVLRTGFANYDQVEAHAIGHLLILRVGSEVFGVLPFNARGEPRAELTDLRVDIAPDISELPTEAGWYQEPIPARVGIRHEGSRLIDAFGRAFTGLSVVRSGYICYRTQAKLVAIDTQTGKKLWERLDLPANCQVSGDEDCVSIWRGDNGRMQIVSAIDGHLLEEIPWKLSPDDVLMNHGGQVWSIDRKPVTTVSLKESRNGKVVWSRTFEADAIPFAMDPTAIGVLERSGILHLLAADTGAPLGEPLTVECPAKVERIVCLHDAQRWYVAISGPVPKLSILQADQLWGGSRVVFVNGWLYGIDRNDAAISWRRHLDSESLPRHASQVAPAIVQLWRRPASDAGGEMNVVGLLRVIDKRTGSEIMTYRDTTLYAYLVLNPSENFETLEISTERETFRLNYQPGKQEPMQERAKDN